MKRCYRKSDESAACMHLHVVLACAEKKEKKLTPLFILLQINNNGWFWTCKDWATWRTEEKN